MLLASPETTEHNKRPHGMNTMNEHDKNEKKIPNERKKHIIVGIHRGLMQQYAQQTNRLYCARARANMEHSSHTVWRRQTTQTRQKLMERRKKTARARAQTEYAWSRSTTINEFQMKQHKWLYSYSVAAATAVHLCIRFSAK